MVDCENDAQCADNRACMDSLIEPGRMLCEKPCGRTTCDIAHSECVDNNHTAACECKEGFRGNASVACIPDGFDKEDNGIYQKN